MTARFTPRLPRARGSPLAAHLLALAPWHGVARQTMLNFDPKAGITPGLYCELEMQQSQPEPLPTILVIDEEPDVVQALSLRLWFAGYRVVWALDGSAAMNLALKERPDLIVIDFRMLEEDGNTIARELGTHPRCAHIPTIAIDDTEPLWRPNPAGYVDIVSGMEALVARIAQALPPGQEPEHRE